MLSSLLPLQNPRHTQVGPFITKMTAGLPILRMKGRKDFWGGT